MKENEKFDMVVIGEVLEHVENPLEFLKKAQRLLTKNAVIYITVPINSPEVDHIYLFRHTDEIVKMIKDAHLTVLDYTEVTPKISTSIETARKRNLPIKTAFILGLENV
jgi:2-polyprenyl-3-methyl-5-hydroxy-6-metoxy-1,4-benzoquinol methylase